MTTAAVRVACCCVRAWTRAYTWRVPSPVREARFEEIDSDLWESINDPDRDRGVRLAGQILARLVIGIPDDLGWRREHLNALDGSLRTRIAVTVGIAGVLTAWLVIALLGAQLPPVPAAPPLSRLVKAPPPPPPPPPPCLPAGLGGELRRGECTR